MMIQNSSDRDLIQAFREQFAALVASGKSFDDGNHWEAFRIATAISNLIDDRGKNFVSLLSHISQKDKVRYLTSVVRSDDEERTIWASAPLILLMHMTPNDVCYVPIFDNHPLADMYRHIDFNEWWNENLLHDFYPLKITRKSLISTARDQDGGAHIDATISDESYLSFLKNGDVNLRYIQNGNVVLGNTNGGAPIRNGIRSMVRQVGWELEKSIVHSLPSDVIYS